MSRAVHPIERESYRILRSRHDFSRAGAAVAGRDRTRLPRVGRPRRSPTPCVLDEDSLARRPRGAAAGAPVVCDSRMAAAGITSRRPVVPLDDPRVAEFARESELTRSAAAMRLACDETGRGRRVGGRQRPHRAV